MSTIMKGNEQFGGPLPPPVLRTAHDVRHLSECQGCDQIGDDRHMIRAEKGKLWHGRCLIRKRGFDALLTFKATELERVTLGDIGVRYMKRLIEAWPSL